MPQQQSSIIEKITSDIVGDILGWLDSKSLLGCNLVSKQIKDIIIRRKLWKYIFEKRCTEDNNWLMPPEGTITNNSWLTYHFRYEKELRKPICTKIRSPISRTYQWRVGSLASKLNDSGQNPRIKSEKFSFTFTEVIDDQEVDRTLVWEILIQRQPKNGRYQYGIYITQLDKVKCFFALATLGHHYLPKQRYESEKNFVRNDPAHPQSCGWLFQEEALTSPDMTLIEFDVTVYPTELNCVQPFYDLIKNDSVEERLRRHLVCSLGEFVTHLASNPNNAKRYVQVTNGGPLPLVDVFENPNTSQALRTAVAGCLWNILDTSTMYIRHDVLERVIVSACRSLIEVLIDQKHTTVSLDSFASCNDVAITDITFRHPHEQEPSSQDSPIALVSSLCGLMWNIPITPENRSLLTRNRSFFVAIAGVLSNDAYRRSHICCLHILTTLKVHGSLPEPFDRRFSSYLRDYLQKNDNRREVPHNVALSLRDVAEFFLPLVFSSNLDCIAFGKWAVSVFYFNTIDIYTS
eukprot:TRINITY_DN15740_c0_g1_i1.p1 TRINITY_DN15740_c0_g1~~TRINITY_DN15740_c0_g1_i1.p1  ORF type:complete len:519 (+),score=63.46 TRINITY_DN15740_c0_g1_i1:76-1632(+)